MNAVASWEKKSQALERITARYLKHAHSALSTPVAVSPAKAHELLDARVLSCSRSYMWLCVSVCLSLSVRDRDCECVCTYIHTYIQVRRWSRFGSCCPVMLARHNRVVSPMVKSSLPSSFPVVYGPHIYLCKSAAAREAFMADVVPLATQRPAQPPALHRIVLIGAPKSGKTSLAAWLARELGVKHIDACSAVEELVQGISHLAVRVKSLLRSGQVCGCRCGSGCGCGCGWVCGWVFRLCCAPNRRWIRWWSASVCVP